MNLLIILLGLAMLSVATPVSAAGAGLNLLPDLRLVALNVGVFLLLVIPTNRLVLRPLLRIIQARGEKIGGALSRSDELRHEAERVRTVVESQLAEAHAAAQAERNTIMGKAEEDSRGILDAARAESAREMGAVRTSIATELTTARATLQSETRELAREAASRVLGRSL